MGWETVAMIGFQALSAGNSMNQADSVAAAQAREGEIKAKSTADDTLRAAGKLTTSFLQSGITLEGGPQTVLSMAFKKGNTDINRIAANADAAAENTVSTARTKALQSLAGSMGGSFMSSVGGEDVFSSAGSYLPDDAIYGLNDLGFGDSAYNMMAKSDARAGGY